MQGDDEDDFVVDIFDEVFVCLSVSHPSTEGVESTRGSSVFLSVCP